MRDLTPFIAKKKSEFRPDFIFDMFYKLVVIITHHSLVYRKILYHTIFLVTSKKWMFIMELLEHNDESK